MAVPLDTIIEVTSTIASADGSANQGFGSVLLATADDAQAASGDGKIRTFDSLAEVGAVYEQSSQPYLAAAAHFAQTPYPKPLRIGRWVQSVINTKLVGGDPNTLTNIKAATGFTLLGEAITIAGLASDTSLSEVADGLQTALQAESTAGLTDATVTYDATAERFELVFGNTSDGDPVAGGYATGALAAALGLDSGAAELDAGAAAETAAEFLDEAQRLDDNWYWVTLDDDLVDTSAVLDVSTWVEASERFLLLDTHEAGALTASASSYAVQLEALSRQRTALVWSAHHDYKAVSLAARFASVNLDSDGSYISAMFKQLPGTTADSLTSAQRASLDVLRVNYYIRVGIQAVLQRGTALSDGVFIDVRFWLDWFVHSVRRSIFGLMLTENRIPQSSGGVTQLLDVVTRVCAQARRNGGIGTGRVTEAVASQIRSATGGQFEGNLTNGYLVFIPPLSTLTTQQIAGREIPEIRVWLKGSSAVHSVDVDITFS